VFSGGVEPEDTSAKRQRLLCGARMNHFLERVWTDTPSLPRIARASAGAVAVLLACASPAAAQQVIADNLTLQTSDPQVLFDDTSAVQANDWRLGKNLSESGSENRFVLEDVTGARTPFQILAGAPTGSFFLSQSGNLGLGTSNPLVELQMTPADTPAIRLEQTNASGFRAQTWDIGANEANFFVRDVTDSSRLPFRIRPGAPTSSIDVRGREGEGFGGVRQPAGHPGDVGIGTSTPTQALHVERDDGTARLLVEETSTTEDSRVLTDLVNNGPALARFTNTAADGQDWQAGNRDGPTS
jgi:hypothetical protein